MGLSSSLVLVPAVVCVLACGLSVQDYTATPDGLMIFADDITYVFRRR
jgi:hypothetical protein